MGASVSSASNSVYTNLKSSITQTMSQKVDANVTVNCQNIQEVIGVTGCDITFGPQVCKAAGVADVTTDANFTAQATQDVLNSVDQQAKSALSGINVGVNVSNSSNFAQTMMDVSTTTTQAFNTDCSKNASAVNRQMVKDCTDSKITFAAQSADVSVMGNCAASATAATSSFNKLTNVVAQKSSSEIKGIDLATGLMIFLFFIVFLFVGPPLLRSMTSSWSSDNTSNPQAVQAAAAATGMFRTLVMLLVGYALIVWPGLISAVLHVWPWAPAITNFREEFCTNGKATGNDGKQYNIDPNAFINNFVFWDEQCALTQSGEQCEQARHYKTCGIFSGLCDDPVAQADIAGYKMAFEACGKLAGFYEYTG